jgi:hypothetical protein
MRNVDIERLKRSSKAFQDIIIESVRRPSNILINFVISPYTISTVYLSLA